jgi:hypothetical protein
VVKPPPAGPVKPAFDANHVYTMVEIKGMVDQAQYADALKAIGRALLLKGKAAEAYDKHDLLSLKAEAHLHVKATAAAILAFEQAAAETEDAQKQAVAKATALLLKRSKNLAYTPTSKKAPKKTPIDVVDPESRRIALRALLADELATVTPTVEAALNGQSLGPIATALSSIQGLDVLELASGAEGESKQLISGLRDRGRDIMARTLQRMRRRADEIDKTANEMVRVRIAVPVAGGGIREDSRLARHGLERPDQQELKEIISTCEQIIPNAAGLVKATGGKSRDSDDLIDQANEIKRKAERTLKADYSI